MKVLTYLIFTLLSILIQFCVTDLIRQKVENQNELVSSNVTSQYDKFNEMLNNFKKEPHALYIQAKINNQIDEPASLFTKSYNNNSIPITEFITMTTSTSTLFEEFYDENLTTTEDSLSTESILGTTEIENVTEITFYENKNQSITKENTNKEINYQHCRCNIKYNICDINCCCDSDCSAKTRKMFQNCSNIKVFEETQHLCYPFEFSQKIYEQYFFENLFCIVKTNLPQKRNINYKKFDMTTIQYSYVWHQNKQLKYTEFQKKPYVYGDAIWVLREGLIWYLDIPLPIVNNYCSGRKSIAFLKEEKVICDVNMKDLEMFQVLKTSQEAYCISVIEKSINSSILNCSTLHCTNWTIRVCNEYSDHCIDYNTTLHEPSCTEINCMNIALRLDYIFYYHDSKIINAMIKFHTQNVSNPMSLMTQEINVKFLVTNNTNDSIIEMSGNPGYIYSLPVISSMTDSNHSSNFFNGTFKQTRYLSHPQNKGGYCTLESSNYVEFGINKRLLCRYVYDKAISTQNSSNVCDDLETNIKSLFRLDNKIYISPLGNPKDITDKDWIMIQSNILQKELTYGQFFTKNSRLRCYNLMTRISYVFAFVDISEVSKEREFRIVDVAIKVGTRNVTFNSDDISTVLTIDTNFVDVTKLETYEYAGAPHLNIHLPRDFFFPFPSNGHSLYMLSVPLMIINVIYVIEIK